MLSFATIVYSKDYPLLRLQALSLARFADPAQVASIHVVLNDRDEPSLRSRIDPILEYYGPLRPKVQVLSGDDVLLGEGQSGTRPLLDRILIENRYRIPFVGKGGWRGNNGYRTQQVLKLGAARVAKSEELVILDTKNLFLRPFSVSDFFTKDGAARIPFVGVGSDFHRNWLCESLEALQVAQLDLETLRTTTFATPFPVRKSLVLDLLDEINTRYGSVQALFASRRRPSEFMLLNAYCLRRSQDLRPWFEDAPDQNIGLWPTFTDAELAKLVGRLSTPDVLSLGLHNRAIAGLSADLLGQVFGALENRGICERHVAEAVLNETSALSG